MPFTHDVQSLPVTIGLTGHDRNACLSPEGGPLDRVDPSLRKVLRALEERLYEVLASGAVPRDAFLKDPLAALEAAGLALTHEERSAVQALPLPALPADLPPEIPGAIVTWEQKP